MKRRLVIVAHDVVGARMAGPGIRYWEMARVLSAALDVTLAAPEHAPTGEEFSTAAYLPGQWETLSPAVVQADALLFSGDLLPAFPQLADCGKPLILDVYDPHTFETLHLYAARPMAEQMSAYARRVDVLRRAARAGDFFICASERQRDYWLGLLDVCGRTNAHTYLADPTLRTLIDVAPFGLRADETPRATTPAIKGVVPGIALTDRVILWGGGLWEWLDPLTLIRAVARSVAQHPDVRLVFFSARHPNPAVPDMPMRARAAALADELGLTGRHVFFLDRWIPRDEWPGYLLEADLGASLHCDTLETHFAFRTRIMDYVWAGLPMIVTGGDETSDVVARHGLGAVVAPGDVDGVARALADWLDARDRREQLDSGFELVRRQFDWARVCEPIARFCQSPHLAPDRAAGLVARELDDLRALRAALAQREQEAHGLRATVAAYERGKFMRLMRWLKRAGR